MPGRPTIPSSHRRGGPEFKLPPAPRSIQKGSSLAQLLDREAVDCLAHNIGIVYRGFDGPGFRRAAMRGIGPLSIMQRGSHLAQALRNFLPPRYDDAVDILLKSLTPPWLPADSPGLAVFFYLPHSSFVAAFGLDAAGNGGRDPFETSMRAQYEITRRFTAEFSMRPFLIRQPERTLARLLEWTRDPDVNVRRLCSEGSRPRLPWGMRIPAFVRDPRPTLPILEALRDDPDLYVRRSVANHLGDIAKDHPQLAFGLCARWMHGATGDRKWIIRHAVRHPAKKGVPEALRLRELAKADPGR
jgi:3-methyladenine DNA glycosylase AlkC